ncbi:leucyl aminopeptidase [Lichenicoccus sp.]|uniref:leucyl aminopeptidase n=1 Tax=Lichenicoccus sp. TaxID=2781899 RepID=UPI003D1091EF
MLEITFAEGRLEVVPEGASVALLVAEEAARPALFTTIDEATGGALTRGLQAAEFTFARSKTCVLLGPGAGLSRVVLVGLGKRADLDMRALEAAGSAAAGALGRAPAGFLAVDALTGEQAAHAALGARLGAYRFDRYRTRESAEDKPRLATLTVLAGEPDIARAARAAWPALEAVAHGVALTRDLVSEPANVLSPPVFAERIAALAYLGLEIETLGPAEMQRLGFGALLGVAMGSDKEPRTVIMRWNGGAADAAPVAFIGKGVTFDSGGISIKPAGGMEDMKWDMAGAGTVVGLMAALAGRQARVNAIGVVGLVENMLSGGAQRPGDVVTSHSGQTIEVLNTDAEGRLVLADMLSYTLERYKPRFMVDLATLTGAIIVGLGHEHAGLFSNDEALAQQLLEAGLATGEALWRMPMGDGYDKLIRSDIADMKNIGGRPGGSITAAQFLKRFVGPGPWAHLDIAGMAWSSKDAPGVPKGATAFGVRLLDRLVAARYEDGASESG